MVHIAWLLELGHLIRWLEFLGSRKFLNAQRLISIFPVADPASSFIVLTHLRRNTRNIPSWYLNSSSLRPIVLDECPGGKPVRTFQRQRLTAETDINIAAEHFPKEVTNAPGRPKMQEPAKKRIVISPLNYYNDPGDGSPPAPVFVGGYDSDVDTGRKS